MSNDNNEMEVFEHEKEILLDHDYDGIKELDHPLPLWWVMIFVLTVSFSIPYYMYYTFFNGPTLEEAYHEDIEKLNKIREANGGDGFDLNEFNTFIALEETQKKGSKIYKRKCKACHGADAEGGIGPNLTDNYWIHGNGSPGTIIHVVREGVLDKGMLAWKDTLSKEDIMAVVGHVMSLKGTNPNNAKEPQGELYE